MHDREKTQSHITKEHDKMKKELILQSIILK